MQPDISVIIPIYNVEKYLPTCLHSVVNQTHSNIEILLVDDCGADASMDIARQYAKKDSRIKILTHERNQGLSAARNTGLRAASAPFVMFLDSDDYYAPEMCQKMLAGITNSGADMAICAVSILYEANEELKPSDDIYYKLKFHGLETLCDEVLQQTDVSAWNKIYRTAVLQKYNITFPDGLRYEDAFFFNAYACRAKTIFFIPEQLYYYRRRAGSIMHDTFQGKPGHSIDHLKIAIKLFEYFQRFNLLELRRNYLIDFLLNYFRLSLDLEPTPAGRKEIRRLCAQFISRHRKWFADSSAFFKNKYITLTKFLTEKENARPWFSVKKHQIIFCGLELWRVDYNTEWVRCFMCGVRIIKMRPRHIGFPARLYPFNIDNQALLSVLRSLPHFTYIPNQGNLGDMLIAAASLLFFKKYNLSYDTYTGKNSEYIVYGGGGIWTADYKNLWEPFLPVFQHAKKVVILPGSFHNCPEFASKLDERFVVFCREKQSYEYLKSFHTKATILLDHDMALRIDEHFWDTKVSPGAAFFTHCLKKCTKHAKNELAAPVSFLLRQDCERQAAIDKGVDLSSFVFADSKTSERDILFMAQTMMTLINTASVVITDRLHVAIASLLLGKETYLLDNNYKKLSNVYSHSLAERPQAFMIKELPPHIKNKYTHNN